MDAQGDYDAYTDRCESLIADLYDQGREDAAAAADYRETAGRVRDDMRRRNPKLTAGALDARVDADPAVSAALTRKLIAANTWTVAREELALVRQLLDHVRTRAVTERVADQIAAG